MVRSPFRERLYPFPDQYILCSMYVFHFEVGCGSVDKVEVTQTKGGKFEPRYFITSFECLNNVQQILLNGLKQSFYWSSTSNNLCCLKYIVCTFGFKLKKNLTYRHFLSRSLYFLSVTFNKMVCISILLRSQIFFVEVITNRL